MINNEPRDIIKKWYRRLNLPQKYDEDFYRALNERADAVRAYDINEYDITESDGIKNLFSALYCCERLSEHYSERWIDEDILLRTLSDIETSLESWYEIKGYLWLGSIRWLSGHLSGKLYRLGRLQFCLDKAMYDVPEIEMVKGENVISVHVQAGEPLKFEDCLTSFKQAVKFFEGYFPTFHYRHFICYSWLLDKELHKYLPMESNILKFARQFEIYRQEPSDRIFNYVFKRGASRDDLPSVTSKTAFAETVKRAAIGGAVFYEGYGVIKKERFEY